MAALSYERRENESDPAWAALVAYRDMGLSRSLVKVAAELGKSVGLMERWNRDHSWRTRVVAYDMEADRRKRIGDMKGVEDMRRRQIRMSMMAQELATLELGKLLKSAKKHASANTLDAALVNKLMESGSKLERIMRGEPGEIIENVTTSTADLTTLTLEELRVMRTVRAKLDAAQAADSGNDTVH